MFDLILAQRFTCPFSGELTSVTENVANKGCLQGVLAIRERCSSEIIRCQHSRVYNINLASVSTLDNTAIHSMTEAYNYVTVSLITR